MMNVIVCPSHSSEPCLYYVTGIKTEDDSTELVQTVEIPDNEERNISVSVNYSSGLNVYSNYHHLISMFYQVKFTVEPTNNGHLE